VTETVQTHLRDSLPANLMQVPLGRSLTQHWSIFTEQMPRPGLEGEMTPGASR
jgi:hypothetical protein